MLASVNTLMCLTDALACVELGRPAHPLTKWWFSEGVKQYLTEGARHSLDAALGLSQRGQDSLRSRLMLAMRDQYIADAAAVVALDPAITAWERCKRLQPMAHSINAAWGHGASKAWPLSTWPAAKRHLHSAASVQAPLPKTVQALADAIKRNAAFSLDADAQRLLLRFI